MKGRREMISAAAGYAARGWRWVCDRFWCSFSALGISSLLWLLVRSGARPTRIVYPCQKVAAANVHAWVGLSLVGLLIRLRKKVCAFLSSSRLVPVTLAAAGFAVLGLVVGKTFNPSLDARFRELREAAERMTEILSPSSSVFVVKNGGGPVSGELRHPALDRLIDLMGAHGLCFYQTEKKGISCSPNGLIAANDVVLIKINCQWDQRGGTNTDVLKGLIYRITQHPDGFTGEIVVADNGQVVNNGGNLNWPNSNADNPDNPNDHTQSSQDVVNLFSKLYDVSAYHWTTIRDRPVAEFDQGAATSMTDGYVVAATPYPPTNFRVSYPKFTTKDGTRISLKRGIYTVDKSGAGSYDKSRLKVINVPVLKSHSGFGVTACVKHYMGVVSQPRSDGHGYMSQGSMGMLLADLGLPVLNILDAIYVNAIPGRGPYTGYGDATRVDTLMASLDPFALDYWASKNVLIPAATSGDVSSMSPDNRYGAFCNYLQMSKDIVLAAGYPVTTDSKRIGVFKAENEAPVLTDVAIEESGSITLRWLEIAPGSFDYTVEQSDDLRGEWKPAPGTWPTSSTEWTGEGTISAAAGFYRVRRDPAP